MTILSFKSPELLTSSAVTTYCLNTTSPVFFIKVLKRSAVALIPRTTGIGRIFFLVSFSVYSYPLMKRCIIVVSVPASRLVFAPRCASSMMKYNLSDLFCMVLSRVSQIVYCLLSECCVSFPLLLIFCVFRK